MAYRFTPAEIEAMKKSITTHCDNEYQNNELEQLPALPEVIEIAI